MTCSDNFNIICFRSGSSRYNYSGCLADFCCWMLRGSTRPNSLTALAGLDPRSVRSRVNRVKVGQQDQVDLFSFLAPLVMTAVVHLLLHNSFLLITFTQTSLPSGDYFQAKFTTPVGVKLTSMYHLAIELETATLDIFAWIQTGYVSVDVGVSYLTPCCRLSSSMTPRS